MCLGVTEASHLRATALCGCATRRRPALRPRRRTRTRPTSTPHAASTAHAARAQRSSGPPARWGVQIPTESAPLPQQHTLARRCPPPPILPLSARVRALTALPQATSPLAHCSLTTTAASSTSRRHIFATRNPRRPAMPRALPRGLSTPLTAYAPRCIHRAARRGAAGPSALRSRPPALAGATSDAPARAEG